MILDTTSKTVEVVLGGAITTNQLEITADWVDTANGSTFAPGGTSLVTNGGTAVTAVAAPGAGLQRQVKSLTIYNADTVNAAVTVRMYDGTNRRRHVSVTLLTGQSLVFTPEGGWQSLDTSANIKQSLGGTTANLTDYATGAWTPADASGAGLALTINSAKYFKLAGLYNIFADITYPATANASVAAIGGLPLTATLGAAFFVPNFNVGGALIEFFVNGGTNGGFFALATNGTGVTNAQLTGARVRIVFPLY
jgi:hypothetical protein